MSPIRKSEPHVGSSLDKTEPFYRSKTITSTERVQILQMPLELSDTNIERLCYLTFSPSTETSREVILQIF